MGTLAWDTLARVEELPGPDEAARVTGARREPGGAGANVAAALARLGGEPTLLTAVGPDFAGSAYEARLQALGVDLQAVVDEAGTAHAWVFTDGAERQHIYFHEGASPAMANLQPVEAPWGHFAPGELGAYPPFMEAVERVSFDPGQEVFHRDPTDVRACLPRADVLFMNRHERERMESVLGHPLVELLSDELEVLVETRGGEGTRVVTVEDAFTVPAVPVTVRDPTGAGDSHRAGFLHALMNDWGVEAAARLGNVLASFTVEAPGTQAALPTLEEARGRYEGTYGSGPF